jgi:hypothetical protein
MEGRSSASGPATRQYERGIGLARADERGESTTRTILEQIRCSGGGLDQPPERAVPDRQERRLRGARPGLARPVAARMTG